MYSFSFDLDKDYSDFLMERHELAADRIVEILDNSNVEARFNDYFRCVAHFLVLSNRILMSTKDGEFYGFEIKTKAVIADNVFRDLNEESYSKSYLNPSYAVSTLGEYGQILCAIYSELRAVSNYAYRQDVEQVLIREELFLEIYGLFETAFSDNSSVPDVDEIKRAFSSFAFDYQEFLLSESVKDSFIRTESLAKAIVCEAELNDISYLYDYGEYISDIEIKMSQYLASLDDAAIKSMADTFTEGFRKGFIATGKDISIKKTAEIRYFIGFERVVKEAVYNLKKMGLEAILHFSTPSFLTGRGVIKRGIENTNPCRQFDSDHERDKEIYFDHGFMEHKLECYKNVLEENKAALAVYAGPACIESFGEDAFSPEACSDKIELSKNTRNLVTEYTSRAGRLLNDYIKGEERSFTIIAFPTPAIGESFEDIFDETVKINTLNYELYRDMQQIIIDELDKADKVHIVGMNGNKTDLTVALCEISDAEKETKFENCVADVNIPVGEVFTSPKLEGTQGVLHVKEVYLNGIQFVDLTIEFKDGIIDNITCGNYADEKENKKFIENYILFNHDTLPMGEFAIGTNTVAYKVTKEYGLEAIMPILIAEKTGPHFAVGDTCYSHEEEVDTFNPDGKRIVAKENRYSRLRDSEPSKAYFNCHTDITIPYDELGELSAICDGGSEIKIISEGRFVLAGLDELNKPLD